MRSILTKKTPMKTIKNVLVLFYTLIILTSCVNDNEFDTPTTNEEENTALNEILEAIATGDLELKTISQIKDLYLSSGEPLQIVSGVVLKGYIVSSDREGNFFKEFYLQDAPENPTAGIKVVLNLTNSYNKYNIGREVYISLKDLYIGETNSEDGVIAIGGKIKTDNPLEIEALTSNQIEAFIFRSENTHTIVPKVVLPNAINKSHIGTFVAIENATFNEGLVGEPYVNPSDDFDTQRELLVCQSLGYFSLPVESSSFSLFANESLPAGGGILNAVVTKDFAGEVFVLAINTTDDVLLNDTRCELLNQDDLIVLLEEDFEETSSDIEIENWTNYIEAGTRNWDSYEDEDTLSIAANIGSFFSRNESTIGWLITAGVDLETTSQEFLSFETSNSFSDGSELEVLISTDWNGVEETITSATWEILPAKIVDDAASFETWVDSGFVELSAYSGTAYIAFKYTGNGDEDFDGTYELDNIKIQGL